MRPERFRNRPLLVGAWALTLLLSAPLGLAHGQDDGYLDHAALGNRIQALVAASGGAASASTIATSHGGRDVWLVTVGTPGEMALDQRPALLVVGNLEGDHVVGSSLALGIIEHLTTSDDPAVAEALASRVFYVVPRLNPDGAEAMFAAVRHDRRGNARPVDDDNDGRTDEDGGDDLNGDGLVTLMRVADPYGDYIVDPDDARLMRRADRSKGEAGTHSVYHEGRDDDGDGFFNEDGAGGVDLNRNFQHAYDYWTADVGPHMVSEPESRGLMDFVVAHPNIAAVLTFGHSDNLVNALDGQGNLTGLATSDLGGFADASNEGVYDVGVYLPERRGGGFGGFGGGGGGLQLRGAQLGRNNDPASGRRPETSVNRGDREYFKTVSEAYREATGVTSVGINREPHGAFFQVGYYHLGIPSFSTQGWSPGESDADNGSTDAKLAAALGDDAFVAWTPYEHPQLGSVEIGGFRPHATTNPSSERLAELGAAHGQFAVQLAGMLPSVAFIETEVVAHGGGIFTVTAEVENSGYFPTALAHALSARAVHPVSVQIGVAPEDVLTGADKTATTASLAGSGGREKFSWVVRGSTGQQVEIKLITQNGGGDTATVTLR